jgi:valyl-tRNA synthetase
MLAGLADVVEKATAGFEAYDHARALEATESFFWTFCDDYLELVKDRAYGGQGEAAAASARAALRLALDVLLRLLAPFLPYATEEVWSWWHDESVHRAPWPLASETATPEAGDPGVLATVGEALAGVRKAKSEAKVGMRSEVSRIELAGPEGWTQRVRAAEADLRAAGRITGALDYAEAEIPEVRGAELIPVAKPKA